MSEKYSEQELERIMREGLAERAGHAADSLEEPVRTRRRDRRGWLAAAAVAAVIVVGVPVAWQTVGQDPASDNPRGDQPVDSPDAVDTTGWRVESYGGVQVRVPPTWGWGGAPMPGDSLGEDAAMDCGVAPFVAPGSSDYENVAQDTPYVGRPVMMTDACTVLGEDGPPEQTPEADSVWLGAEVGLGTVELGNGYVRETVGIGDTSVTVTTDDDALRAAILATAEFVEVDANGCPTRSSWADVPDDYLDEIVPDSLSVCAYSTWQGKTTLTWSARRGAAQARAYAERVQESSATYDPVRICTEPPEGEWLAIGVNDAQGRSATTAVVLGECAQIQYHYRVQGEPESLSAAPVIPRTVVPWAGSEARAYLAGPIGWDEYAGEDGADVFRGYLG